MSALGDLDAQIAQRLFGWAIRSCESPCPFEGSRSLMGAYHEGWHDAAGRFFFAPPAYTTDPAATAQVWQWVEAQQRDPVEAVYFEYYRGTGSLVCLITTTARPDRPCERTGATWPEALCRAALALAESLERAKT